MKTMNNFQISGFVVNNATINQFATASIARFGLSVRRTEKIGDEEKKVSAILNIEAWKSNEAADAFNILTKGARVLVEEDGLILGCHAYGAHAADMVQEVSVLMCKHTTIHELADMVHIHPTLSEILKNAAD